MTFQNMLDEINRHINEVPIDIQHRKLTGRPVFLQELANSILTESDEAHDAENKYRMVYRTYWSFADERTNPTIVFAEDPRISNAYHRLRIRTGITGKWNNEVCILQFTRKRKKVSATKSILVIDHAELVDVAPNWTMQEFYENRFRKFEQVCQQTIQSIKQVDYLIKTVGLDEVIKTISALYELKKLSGLSQYIDGNLEKTIFDETVRQKILQLEHPALTKTTNGV